MMDKGDPSSPKLYTKLRLWEFPDQYVIEPTDGSSASCLAISRVDASMHLIGLSSIISAFSSFHIILLFQLFFLCKLYATCMYVYPLFHFYVS